MSGAFAGPTIDSLLGRYWTFKAVSSIIFLFDRQLQDQSFAWQGRHDCSLVAAHAVDGDCETRRVNAEFFAAL